MLFPIPLVPPVSTTKNSDRYLKQKIKNLIILLTVSRGRQIN